MGKIKRIISIMLALALLAGMVPATAGAAEARATIVDSGSCGDNLSWSLDDEGTLVISGTGPMINGTYSTNVPWYEKRNLIQSVQVEDGVTTIGNSAFYNCDILSDITIPDSVTSIGDSAFYRCSDLTSIVIPDSVTTIGADAFRGTFLTSIIIPDSVTTIGDAAFYDIDTLKSVTIGNGVVSIGLSAFEHCERLTSVILGRRLTLIPYSAFRMCTNLYDIFLPKNITKIANAAFSKCDNLTEVWYTGSLTDRNNITVTGSNNTALTDAIWYYNICSDEHTYSGPCDATCNNCTWIRDALSHTNTSIYSFNAEKHWFACSVCGEAISSFEVHLYDNTCDTDCNICGCARIITHTYNNACDDVCNVCAFIRTVPEHSYTLNSGHTCDICKYSKTPNAPVVQSKTNNSVTLVKIQGFEYSKNGTTWQTSNVFSNLSFNTTYTYTFYQRVKASTTARVSDTSAGTTVTFKLAQPTPSAPIVSSFTDISITLVPIANCEYSNDGKNWQTSNVFTDLNPGTTYIFYQRYAESDTCEASNSSFGTSITTDKSKQSQIPNAPAIQEVTSNTIILVPVEGCEYSKDGATWQTSNIFSGLSCATEYTFYQRYEETTTTHAGKSSIGCTAKTDKGIPPNPAAPTLKGKTYNSVTLVEISGYEYSRDGINWQTNNVFFGLNPDTNYLFYQREAETETHYASASSTYLIVKTDEEPICVTNPEAHIFTNYISDGNATCIADGTKTAKCERCGAMDVQTDTGTALGHKFTEYVSDGNATCTANGTLTAKCERCEATDTVVDSDSKLGHSFTDYVSNDDATCTADGTLTAKCDRCDAIDTQIDVGSELGHSFTSYVSNNDATCLEDGTKTAKCDRCDVTDTLVDTGSALGHNLVEIPAVEATCTETGLTAGSMCDRCEHIAVAQEEIVALGHSFTSYTSDRNATCTTDGTKTAGCDRCDATDTQTEPGSMMEHNFENGFCTGCGIPDRVPGDLDDKEGVTSDDVVILLLYISMPDMFALPDGVNADYTGDGAVTTDDAVALLLHISMPDMFPLQVS